MKANHQISLTKQNNHHQFRQQNNYGSILDRKFKHFCDHQLCKLFVFQSPKEIMPELAIDELIEGLL